MKINLLFLSLFCTCIVVSQNVNVYYFVVAYCTQGVPWLGLGKSNIASPKPGVFLSTKIPGPCLSSSTPPLRAYDQANAVLTLLFANNTIFQWNVTSSSSDCYTIFSPPPPPNGAVWESITVQDNQLVGMVSYVSGDPFCKPNCLARATQTLPNGPVQIVDAIPFQTVTAPATFDITSDNYIVQVSGPLKSGACADGGGGDGSSCLLTIDSYGDILTAHAVEIPVWSQSQSGQGNFTINGVANNVLQAYCYGGKGCFATSSSNYQVIRTILETGQQENGFCLCNVGNIVYTIGSFDSPSQRFIACGTGFFHELVITVWALDGGNVLSSAIVPTTTFPGAQLIAAQIYGY